MNRAERRRQTVHKARPAFCLGCGDALGRRGAMSAEITADGYVHNKDSCRNAARTVTGALRRFVKRITGVKA